MGCHAAYINPDDRALCRCVCPLITCRGKGRGQGAVDAILYYNPGDLCLNRSSHSEHQWGNMPKLFLANGACQREFIRLTWESLCLWYPVYTHTNCTYITNMHWCAMTGQKDYWNDAVTSNTVQRLISNAPFKAILFCHRCILCQQLHSLTESVAEASHLPNHICIKFLIIFFLNSSVQSEYIAICLSCCNMGRVSVGENFPNLTHYCAGSW